ncbi:unnamed protein product [Arabis nemorensis]|uniref:MATH domain-containing protein n=1 Tax=Arabis nemorensis TaxID=586526 RepID=A0A565BB20_9BRAS|nr:unnamed protein product [Arabis nemorensis]
MWRTEKSCVVSDSTITNKFGDRPPCTYSIKIQSLSQLKTTCLSEDRDRYKSRTFASGNYNWRLVVYPKGNEKDNGSGFISMYVELDSTSLSASTVLAYLTFFVYNKKENKYFTIQDVEGKQFNALRPVWGFPQVLPLDTFNDPKSGYVFEGDQCEFGVDVMVPLNNWEVFSIAEKPSIFPSSLGRMIKLFPKGKQLSLYLYLAENEKLKAGETIYMQANIRILDPFGCNHVTKKLNVGYQNPSRSWGWGEFLSIAELGKAYLDKEGSLKIEIEFEAVSTTKYSP